MTLKRTAIEAGRPSTPRRATKRSRAPNGMTRNVLTTSPARPPRMPRFDHESTALTERRLLSQINHLSPPELVQLVKDVENRFRQLAAFEAEEIRRAQALGFASRNSPLAVVPHNHTTAW